MLKKFIYCLISVLIFTSALNAQDSTNASNFISIEYGIHHLSDQDLILSPFILKDLSGANISLTYKRYARLAQWVEISFDAFDPTYPEPYNYYTNPDSTIEETINNDFTFVRLNYGIGKTLRSSEKCAWTVGGMVENTVMAKYYYAGYFSTFGYFASFGLSAWSQFGYAFDNKNSASVSMHFPLMAWVCRSPYLANDDMFIENTESHKGVKTFFAYVNDGNLQTVNKLQQFNLKLDYIYKINPKFSVGATYQFSILHNNTPVNLTSIQNGLNIKATYNF